MTRIVSLSRADRVTTGVTTTDHRRIGSSQRSSWGGLESTMTPLGVVVPHLFAPSSISMSRSLTVGVRGVYQRQRFPPPPYAVLNDG